MSVSPVEGNVREDGLEVLGYFHQGHHGGAFHQTARITARCRDVIQNYWGFLLGTLRGFRTDEGLAVVLFFCPCHSHKMFLMDVPFLDRWVSVGPGRADSSDGMTVVFWTPPQQRLI